jgi:hypothetical protein
VNRVGFVLTADDLIAAQRQYQWLGIKAQALLVLVVSAFGLYFALAHTSGLWRLALLLVLAAMLATRVVWPFYARFWGIPRMVRRALAQDPAVLEPTEISWDEHSFALSSASNTWQQPLGEFLCWIEDVEAMLLFKQVHAFQIVPKRAFADPAQHGSLIAALAANGVKDKWPPL